ncbi:hypothetical protein CEXT_23761, partial [Caerostris extrusa]
MREIGDRGSDIT